MKKIIALVILIILFKTGFAQNYNNLPAQTYPLQGTDLMASWRFPGPLKKLTLDSLASFINGSGGGGGGTGTVTSFSSGNLSPLFTTSVSNATTTPALSFAQITQNANLVFAGPVSGSAAAPTFRSLTTADLPPIATGGAGNDVTVIAATTGNINLSNPGTAVFDGITVSSGDSILVWQQSTLSQNGVYVFNGSSSALTRAPSSDAASELNNQLVSVEQGSTYAAHAFSQIRNVVTVNTDAVQYVDLGVSSAVGRPWTLNGNANTPSTNKLGSINNRAVRFFSNNVYRGEITAAGVFGWGTSDQFKVSTAGALTIGGAASSHNSVDSMLVINASTKLVGYRPIPSSGGGSSSLTATYIGFGDGSNNLTGSSALTWLPSTTGVTVVGSDHTSGKYSLSLSNDDASFTWGYRNDGYLMRNSVKWSVPYDATNVNISFGGAALNSINIPGAEGNDAFGYDAGKNITTGDYNLLFGYQAGLNITTGRENTVIAPINCPLGTTASYNSMFGTNVICGNGTENAFFGDYVGNTSLTGSFNTFIGQDMMNSTATSCAHNIAIGYACSFSTNSRQFSCLFNSVGKSDNTISFGGVYDFYNGMYLGGGESNVSSFIQDFRLSTTSAASGQTDLDVKDFYISTGKSTGSGAAGNIIFQNSTVSGSSSTQNSWQTDFIIRNDGVLEAPQIHNNAAAADDASHPVLRSGTYTPTPSGSSNLDSDPTLYQCQWLRDGNVVTVGGKFTAQPTATGAQSSFQIDVPISTIGGSDENIAGTAVGLNTNDKSMETVQIKSNAGTALFLWFPKATEPADYYFTFTYVIN